MTLRDTEKENVRQILSEYLLEFNDEITRNEVVEALEKYFRYARTDKVRVVCDETNNPKEESRRFVCDVHTPLENGGEEKTTFTVDIAPKRYNLGA